MEARDDRTEFEAKVVPSLSVDFELAEDQLEKFADCVRRSGKVTFTLKNIGPADLGKGETTASVAVH